MFVNSNMETIPDHGEFFVVCVHTAKFLRKWVRYTGSGTRTSFVKPNIRGMRSARSKSGNYGLDGV